MADEELRSLDIPDKQLLVHRGPGVDAECNYHHLILLHRVSESKWIALTHNARSEPVRINEDLDELQYTVLRRGAVFPQYAVEGGLLYFDEIDPLELRQHRRDAKEEAHLQGGEGEAVDGSSQWRFCDPNLARFAKIVDADTLEDDTRFTELGGHGVAIINDTSYRCELVDTADLDNWKKTSIADMHGSRILPRAAVPNSLASYLKAFPEVERPEWSFDGSRVAREWLSGISRGPGNMVSYHAEWTRLSGVSEGSAQCHEHRQICEYFRQGIFDDLLDVQNLSSFESLARRVVQLEMAVEKNPKHPDFSGLGVLVDGTVSSSGAVRVPKFQSWISTRQKEQAEIFKQRRLYTEEQSKITPPGDSVQPKAKAGPKKVAKAKY